MQHCGVMLQSNTSGQSQKVNRPGDAPGDHLGVGLLTSSAQAQRLKAGRHLPQCLAPLLPQLLLPLPGHAPLPCCAAPVTPGVTGVTGQRLTLVVLHGVVLVTGGVTLAGRLRQGCAQLSQLCLVVLLQQPCRQDVGRQGGGGRAKGSRGDTR